MAPKRESLISHKARISSSPLKPAMRPPELSEDEHNKISAYLDSTDKPFKVTTIPYKRKRKRQAEKDAESFQQSTFDDRLNVWYRVMPGTTCNSLRRYQKFTLLSESIAVGEYVLVAHEVSDKQEIEVLDQWKAQVQDVRALDQEHVYIRVAWLNRPEDLETRRKPYHGKNELIPTNQIDIINAKSVNGSFSLVRANENEGDTARLEDNEFFWRQT